MEVILESGLIQNVLLCPGVRTGFQCPRAYCTSAGRASGASLCRLQQYAAPIDACLEQRVRHQGAKGLPHNLYRIVSLAKTK